MPTSGRGWSSAISCRRRSCRCQPAGKGGGGWLRTRSCSALAFIRDVPVQLWGFVGLAFRSSSAVGSHRGKEQWNKEKSEKKKCLSRLLCPLVIWLDLGVTSWCCGSRLWMTPTPSKARWLTASFTLQIPAPPDTITRDTPGPQRNRALSSASESPDSCSIALADFHSPPAFNRPRVHRLWYSSQSSQYRSAQKLPSPHLLRSVPRNRVPPPKETSHAQTPPSPPPLFTEIRRNVEPSSCQCFSFSFLFYILIVLRVRPPRFHFGCALTGMWLVVRVMVKK